MENCAKAKVKSFSFMKAGEEALTSLCRKLSVLEDQPARDVTITNACASG